MMPTSESVERLLSLGEPHYERWKDYSHLGIGPEHVPELVELLCDEHFDDLKEGDDRAWAPVHAWRALGQLRAEEAIQPMLDQLWRGECWDDDWFLDDLPRAIAMLGPVAVEPIRRYLLEEGHGTWPRISALDALTFIVKEHSEIRDTATEIVMKTLRLPYEAELKGFCVAALVDLGGVEAIDDIREAYRMGAVDESVCGDLEQVEIRLGLRKERTRHHLRISTGGRALPITNPGSFFDVKFRTAGRNDPCPCGSGIKYKKCCLNRRAA
jgi:hypothetical protein